MSGNGWLYEYQTFIAGFMALFGAVITTATLIKQHAFDQNKYRDDQRKIGFYRRSWMPDALSALLRYSEECFEYAFHGGTRPDKPHAEIGILKENIQYADVDTSNNLFKIVSFYQVHNDRLDSYKTSESIAINANSEILYDIAWLCHYFNSLWPYARNDIETVKNVFPDEKEMQYAIKSMIGVSRYLREPQEYDPIFEPIERKSKRQEEYSHTK